MSTEPHASERPPVFVYLSKLLVSMYLSCWILISICLLIQINVNITTRKRPPVFVYLCKLLVIPCAYRMNIQYVCLLIQINVNRTTCKRPPVFVYLCKLLVVPCAVRMNIQYLFVYLFKSMSTKAGASDHLYLFIYANKLLSPCAVRMNINIYLFTSLNWCQQKLALLFR